MSEYSSDAADQLNRPIDTATHLAVIFLTGSLSLASIVGLVGGAIRYFIYGADIPYYFEHSIYIFVVAIGCGAFAVMMANELYQHHQSN